MTFDLSNRYSRQTLLPEIGAEGQKRLGSSTVLVVGCGALGCTVVEVLARAGVGHLFIVDRDVVDLSNLHRQILFDEEDARQALPKAVAAARRLKQINSAITVTGQAADFSVRNAVPLIRAADVVIDGTDNVETRYLINDACVKLGKPWIYGGAVGTSGVTLSIVPGAGPCLRCVFPDAPPPGSLPTCDTAGVLGATPVVIGAMEAALAIKLLVGDLDEVGHISSIDVWHGDHARINMPRKATCPACGDRNFEFLSRDKISWATSLCGRNAVQITPPADTRLDLAKLKGVLERTVDVTYNGITLTCVIESLELIAFADGRVIVKGTTDVAAAKTLVAKYLGW